MRLAAGREAERLLPSCRHIRGTGVFLWGMTGNEAIWRMCRFRKEPDMRFLISPANRPFAGGSSEGSTPGPA